jgi:hypothetical protein
MADGVLDAIRMKHMLTWEVADGIVGNIGLETQRTSFLILVHSSQILFGERMRRDIQSQLGISAKQRAVVTVHTICHGLIHHLLLDLMF